MESGKVAQEWQHERRLVYAVSEKWSGWFCERCCWNRPRPPDPRENERLARGIQQEFLTHDCGSFAAQHWR